MRKATLPCDLSLIACFSDINVSHARYTGSSNIHLSTNLPRNFPVKDFLNQFRFDIIMVMSVWPTFLANPVAVGVKALSAEFAAASRNSAMTSATIHKI